MCGIVGIVSRYESNYLFEKIKSGMMALQHRGLDGFGLAYQSNGIMTLQTQLGAIPDTLTAPKHPITMALGHTRYKTSGLLSSTQPIWIDNKYFVHNGQVNIAKNSKKSDSQYMMDFLSQKSLTTMDQIITALNEFSRTFKGSYSCIFYDADNKKIISFRDPNGIRPLVIGTCGHGSTYSFASETVALTAMDHQYFSEVHPGEVIVLSTDTMHLRRAQYCPRADLRPCLFEYIYLAHKDSVMNGALVSDVRKAFGRSLANHPKLGDYKNNPDVIVVPVPKTSCPAAKSLAQALNVPFMKLMHRKKGKGRSFILSSQEKRQETVDRKFTFDANDSLGNKTLLIVDDSIVRGTTMKYVVKCIRDHYNPTKVCVVSIAPPLLYPNVYGIDIPTNQELIAVSHRNNIAEALGADQIIYQKLTEMIKCLREINPVVTQYETSVFNGEYITN